MEADVKTHVESAQRKQKLYYDQKHAAGDLFTVGSLVLKKVFRRKRRRGGKMDYRWQGPFVITSVLGKGLYSLKERDGDQVLDKLMHVSLPKPSGRVFLCIQLNAIMNMLQVVDRVNGCI